MGIEEDKSAFRRLVIADLACARSLMLSQEAVFAYKLLRRRQTITSTELAELGDYTLQTATNILKNLYLQGYATRRKVPANTEGKIRTTYEYSDAINR